MKKKTDAWERFALNAILSRHSTFDLKKGQYAAITSALTIGSGKTMDPNKHTTERINPNPKNHRAASYTDPS